MRPEGMSIRVRGSAWNFERPPPGPRAFRKKPHAPYSPLMEMYSAMKHVRLASVSTAAVFAAAIALAGFAQAQEKPQEGAPSVQQEKPAAPKAQDKMQKKAPARARNAAKKSNPEVMTLQAALKKAGEDPGPADGVMGRKTRSALRAFQKKNGLKTTGRADKETMAKLQPFMGK